MNGYAPEKSADLIVFIHFYVLLGTSRHQKEAILSLLAADCNHGILNGYAPEYVRQSFSKRCISFDSYIKPQLYLSFLPQFSGCISFDSYIKPQPLYSGIRNVKVVYLLIPTSNHNFVSSFSRATALYIF